MKNHIIFNTDDAQALIDSDNIGAFVRSSSSGALITNHSLFNIPAAAFTFVDADVTPGTDTITKTTHNYRTGDYVQLTSTGVLPAGLALITDYWIIRVDSNNFKLASSPFNAENQIAVDITAAAGGGTHTVTGYTREARHLDVFAAVADGEGNKITSTGGALDVNLKSADISFTADVSLDGVYSGSNLLADSVGNIFNSRAVTPDITGQVERVTAALLGNVAAADVSKVHALDTNAFLMAEDSDTADKKKLLIDGTSNGLWVDIQNASLPVTQSGTWTVGLSEDHNWGTVGANTLRVASEIGNASGMADFDAGVSGAQTLRVTIATDDVISTSDAALANTAIVANIETLAVANTAQVAVASPLAARKYLMLANNTKYKMFIGGSGVDAATGFPLYPGSVMELRAGAASAVYFVGETTGPGQIPVLNHLELS